MSGPRTQPGNIGARDQNLTHAATPSRPRDYIERRRAEGKSTREAIRCLKRYLARHVWRLLQPPNPGPGHPHRSLS